VREQQGRMSRELRVTARQAEATALLTSGAVPQYTSKKSSTGPVTTTRVSHGPEVTGQVYSAKAGLRSSWEVKPTGQGLGQEGAWPGTGAC